MRKLIASEKKILNCLIFQETYEVILEETGSDVGALRDDLITLVNYRLIEIIDSDNPDFKGSAYYDSDNVNQFTFRATKAGLKHIRETV